MGHALLIACLLVQGQGAAFGARRGNVHPSVLVAVAVGHFHKELLLGVCLPTVCFFALYGALESFSKQFFEAEKKKETLQRHIGQITKELDQLKTNKAAYIQALVRKIDLLEKNLEVHLAMSLEKEPNYKSVWTFVVKVSVFLVTYSGLIYLIKRMVARYTCHLYQTYLKPLSSLDSHNLSLPAIQTIRPLQALATAFDLFRAVVLGVLVVGSYLFLVGRSLIRHGKKGYSYIRGTNTLKGHLREKKVLLRTLNTPNDQTKQSELTADLKYVKNQLKTFSEKREKVKLAFNWALLTVSLVYLLGYLIRWHTHRFIHDYLISVYCVVRGLVKR